MPTKITDRIKVIDVDAHVTEPEDVWTARVSSKWGDKIPHVEQDSESGEWHWMWGGKPGSHHPVMASASWKEPYPSFPKTMEDVDPAAWRPHHRLERMDEYGMHAQVIYPNVGGFGSGRFMEMKDPELQLECVRAYNDFLTEWCSADPKRLCRPKTAPDPGSPSGRRAQRVIRRELAGVRIMTDGLKGSRSDRDCGETAVELRWIWAITAPQNP